MIVGRAPTPTRGRAGEGGRAVGRGGARVDRLHLQAGGRRAAGAADLHLDAVGAVGEQRLGAGPAHPRLGRPGVRSAAVGRRQGAPVRPGALLAQPHLHRGPGRGGPGPGDAHGAEGGPAQRRGQRGDPLAPGGGSGLRRGQGGGRRPVDSAERGRGDPRRHRPGGRVRGGRGQEQRRQGRGDRGQGEGGKAERGESAHSDVFRSEGEVSGLIGWEALATVITPATSVTGIPVNYRRCN